METADKYNTPHDYSPVFPELNLYKDTCCFIFTGCHPVYDFKLRTDENFLEQITEARDAGKHNIIFDCAAEGFHIGAIGRVHFIAEKAKLLYPDLNFFYLTGDLMGADTYKKVCQLRQLTPVLEMISCYFFEFQASKYYSAFSTEYIVRNRSKIYTCLNRRLQPHRIQLLENLLMENLVNSDCYYSFYNSECEDGGLTQLDTLSNIPNIKANLEVVKTLKLNVDPIRTNPVDLRKDDIPLYDDVYFSVITETLFYRDEMTPGGIFISEKTYKPFAMLHPFVMMGVPNTLSSLRDRGYKTFHPYIDESYDSIEDDNLRLEAVVAEIKRLSSQTPEQWLVWCENIKPIVEHNQRNFYYGNSSYICNVEDLITRLTVV